MTKIQIQNLQNTFYKNLQLLSLKIDFQRNRIQFSMVDVEQPRYA